MTDISAVANTPETTNVHASTQEPGGQVSAKQAAAILQFLQRTQMQGAEMPAYVDVFNTLSAIVAAAQSGDLAAQ